MSSSREGRPGEPASTGLLFGLGAYGLWGLVPLYFRLLDEAGALEVLAHRVAWSLVFVALLLWLRPRPGWWPALRARPRSLGLLTIAAVVIVINWGTYIWAILAEHVVEASLGYFINPLFTVLLGVVVLRERLTRPQWVALTIAAVAVTVLTLDYGRPPWVAFVLAGAFGIYGLCKKKAGVAAVESLAVETLVLAPLALGYMIWLELTGGAVFGHAGWANMLLFAGAGVVTAVPLLLFAGAATRLPMTILGLLQYVTPTTQFLLGVLVFGEPMPPSRLVGFALIWLALAVFTWDSLNRMRRARRAAAAAL